MRTAYKILLLGFVLRLIPFVYVAISNPDGLMAYDSYGYWNLANNLVEHQVFSQAFSGHELIPDISRTPTFPVLLVLLKFLGNNIYWVSFILLLLGALSVLLTYRITEIFTENQKVMAIAALLVAVDIPSIFFSSIILTETVFTTLFLWILYLFFKTDVTIRRALLIGLLLSVLILCRPIALYLPLLFVGFLVVKKRGLKPIITLGLSSYLLVFAWMYRNYDQFDMFTLTTIGTTNLYFHTSAAILEDAEGISALEANNRLWSDLYAERDWKYTVAEVKPMTDFCDEKAWGYIKQYPMTFAKHCGIGVIYFFYKPIRGYIDNYIGFNNSFNPISRKNINPQAMDILKNETSVVALILVVFQFLMMVFITIGIAVGLLRSGWQKELFFCLIIIGYFALFSAFTEVDGRFRIPIIPLLALLGAIGWSKVLPKKFISLSSVSE